jgi:hypothetical protein
MSSSSTKDSWLAEKSSDDISVVELFFKSLDSSAVAVADHCLTASSLADSSADVDFIHPTINNSEKFGYEPFTLSRLSSVDIKQEPSEETCFIQPSPGELEVNCQFLHPLPSLQKFPEFRYSSQFEG